MSSARQAVHRGESFTGFGKRPDFTPSHQLVLPRGIRLKTCANRKNPVSGMSCISSPPFRFMFHIKDHQAIRLRIFSTLNAFPCEPG
jgi:hypothetical protein